MVSWVRWVVVAAVALVLAAAPLVTHTLPARQSDIGAVRLADRIRASTDVGWSGEVRSLGSLKVPLTGSTFGGVARILGEETDLRVWWRSSTNWRLDRMRATGESDLVRDGGLTVRWNYEDNRVNFTPYSPIRLPDDVDLVPSALAARLLSGAKATELTRLPARRIAGHSAPGLRLVPADLRSTIRRVDVWADESSGLPLRVEVYGEPAGAIPVLRTELVSLDLRRPSKARADFRLSPKLGFSRGVALDEAAGANAFAPFEAPDTLLGLPRRGDAKDFGAVGVYGRGPTAILAIPLRGSTARGLHDQIAKSKDARETGNTIALEIGPISVRLVDGERANFLLTGTVTPETLTQAGIELVRTVRRTE
jgi:hypothetical protein